MAIDLPSLKLQCNIVDASEDAILSRLLSAAQRHVESILGYALDDAVQLPNGAPQDIEQAVLMLSAHWYENREATLVGVSAQEVPMGVAQILAEHRSYTFG